MKIVYGEPKNKLEVWWSSLYATLHSHIHSLTPQFYCLSGQGDLFFAQSQNPNPWFHIIITMDGEASYSYYIQQWMGCMWCP